MRNGVLIIWFIFLVFKIVGVQSKQGLTFTNVTQKLKIGQQVIDIDVADTDKKRNRGLKWRQSLSSSQGMLFIYQDDRSGGFWMKDTLIDLDIAFLNKDGIIVWIDSMRALTMKIHKPEVLYRYALELKAGFIKQHNIKLGDKVIVVK